MENRSHNSKKMTPEQIFNIIRILMVILLIVGSFALGEVLHGTDVPVENEEVGRKTTIVEHSNNQEYLIDKNNIGAIRIETLSVLNNGEYQAVLSIFDTQGNVLENCPVTLVVNGDGEYMDKYDLTIVKRIDK